MIRIAIGLVLAMLATTPSFLVAKLWLRRNGHDVGPDGTIQTFMSVAPGPLKFGLVAMNFINASLLCMGGMAAYGLLVDA